MKTNYRHNIGSVSHGTMRPEDLIPDFLYELEHQKPLRREHRKLISQIEKSMVSCRCDVPCRGQAKVDNEDLHRQQYFESEDAIQDLEELFSALDCYAPPYFYFGAHPGDGSDYGWWLPDDFLQEWKDYGDLKVDDLSEVPRGYTGEVLHVNDHGNMSLYVYSRGKGRELWAIV